MIFWIFIALLVAGVVLMYIASTRIFNFDAEVGILGTIMTVIGGIALGVSLIFIICEYCAVDGTVASNNERYEMLVYQYENDVYENDNDLGKYELMKDIQEWNEDIAYIQAVQDDFWIGIYYANIYDQFKVIELKEPISDVQN